MQMKLSKQEILEYEQKALASIPKDHPHAEEIKKLLIEQVNDDLHSQDATHAFTNR